jgi:hypothetical protein
VLVVLVVRACGHAGAGANARAAKSWAMEEAWESSPVAGGDASGRRGRQSHVNLQFSSSFFVQDSGTPNGRLRERAARLDVLDGAWRALDCSLCWDCAGLSDRRS